jgi:hypothetical protein
MKSHAGYSLACIVMTSELISLALATQAIRDLSLLVLIVHFQQFLHFDKMHK